MTLHIKRTIEVSQETYDRLQQRAVAFEDTPDSVVVKLLDESDARVDGAPAASDGTPGNDRGAWTVSGSPGENLDVDIVVDDPFSLRRLKHTKVLRAEVGGRVVAKANWTVVRQAVVAIALGQAGYTLRSLLEVCPMNAVERVKNDEGYTHYEDLGVSIQGQDANHAWEAAAAAARALGVTVKVWFQWRSKTDAAFPGKRGLVAVE